MMQTSTQNNHENHTFKNSRKLTAPQLTPDVLRNTGGYLAVPNQLLNCAKYGLKPAHLAILLYLLAKPALTATGEQWRVNYTHMAEQLGIGETYAPKYVTYLHEKGFLEIVRLESGATEWHVKIPEQFITAPIAVPPEPEPAPVTEPQRENSHGENIHVEIVAPLYINKVVDITKKTTNEPAAHSVQNFTSPVVVSSENETAHANLNAVEAENKALPVVAVDLPKEINVTAVKSKISLLAKAQQIMVLTAYLNFMAKGNVKNPIGVALDFCDKVTKGGLFVAAAPENVEAIKQAKKNDQERVIQGIVNRNKEKIIADLEAKGFVHFHGLGNFTRDMLKAYL